LPYHQHVRIDVLTLFPGMFSGPLDESILGRARAAGLLDIRLYDIRGWATDKHRVVDDYAYGGGPGMVMKPEPLVAAVEAVQAEAESGLRVLLTPQGELLSDPLARELAEQARLLLICGHYEGVDERVRQGWVDREVSIGDYVISGGELAALVLIDAVARHLPGVLGSEDSLSEESHARGLLEYPQYTRPAEFRGLAVPEVLLSGHHAEIDRWRRREMVRRTALRRPDLLATAQLDDEERDWADELALDAAENDDAEPETA
jgi:tRNA (guanine37-N1)-methyltransferase